MPSRKSWVWKYCTKSDDRKSVTCNICDAIFEYSGSTSSLNKHLKAIHLMNNENSTGNHDEQRDHSENRDDLSNDEGNARNVGDVENSIPEVPIASSSSQTSNTNNTRQPPRKRKLKRKADGICSIDRQENISQALARLIVVNQLPLSLAESEGFRQFMATIEPGYVVPATKTILSRLQLIYDKVKTTVQHEMQREDASISCSTDIWTSLSQDAFLSVTAHYIDEEKWELKHYTLCTIGLEERHTAENIALGLEMIFSDWDIENQIFALVHDNASNMINAGEILQSAREHINCAAHTLQLAVNDALQLEEIACIIQKARKIVGHFKHSALATQELHNTQIKLNFPEEALIQSCPTRWNSTYYMCERLYKNRTPILAVFNNTSVTKPAQARNLEMAASEWSIIDELVTLLKPLQCATTVFCSSCEITISLVRPVIRGIIDNHLAEDILDGNLIRTLKCILRQSLIRRFNMESQSNQKVSVHQIASFLDPRHKTLTAESCEAEKIKIKDFIKEKLQTLASVDAPEENSQEIVTALDFIFRKGNSNEETGWQKQLDYYVMETTISHNESPLEWWKTRAKKYPALAKLARKYLAIPATSASSERAFSSAGNIVTRKRSCLAPDTTNLLVFLYENRQFFPI